MLQQIRDLFRYNAWADARILTAVEQLGPDEFRRHIGGSFPSVQLTLAHLLSSETIWLERWRGRTPAITLTHWDAADLEEMRVAWSELQSQQFTFVGGLSEESLNSALFYRSSKGEEFQAPLWQLLLHLVNHSTYHRGQITLMIRQLGMVPVGTDLVLFHRLGSPAPGG